MSTLKEQVDNLTPYANAFSITPHDTNNIRETRAISINNAANAVVNVIMSGGQQLEITLCPGVLHPLQVIRVLATNTTATGIIGYY